MSDLNQQGRTADEKLEALGLTLTQGGEPTFVPLDTTAPEWNMAAVGENKLFYTRRLARQLAATLYPGAVMVQSSGKLFPGEPLPRWQIGLYRSRSGKPVWNDWNRLRNDTTDAPPATAESARLLLRKLAASLKLKNSIVPVFENLEAHLRLRSDDLAKQLLPRFSRRRRSFKSSRIDPKEFEELAGYFEPAGWVLPMDHTDEGWITERWDWPAGEDMILIPGDSPIGLRLPLASLPEKAMQSALSVECKEGELIVFLPPLPSFEPFCELVRLIEKVATRLDLPPLRIEGYRPPSDPDLEAMTFMSDPGVVEVNLPPADNWPEFQRVVEGLFSAAEASELRSFKFQISGRRVSSGGGAHIILGGPDLERNPFLHRPHLLASFLRFFQNHPSLSYVFTGLYTGPSCQAPRVDENACELPYELEITLAELERMAGPADPAKVDALLRNLLMDWNGNTHRAEISVDKFYNGESPSGQLGLVEFRAFEMMPSPEMFLAPNLLLRALAAAFAEKPYPHPLIDWRETLHDRFALPVFLRQDLAEVMDFLNQQGFSFDPAWFDPIIKFRFPILTRFTAGGANWTLRQAIEPWPVMGDHSGTGRIVDGTTDRLELFASDRDVASRLIATVNDCRLPLKPALDNGAVSGIRYRLFSNPFGLQPHVGAHSPLAFKIIDAQSRKVVHAFDYLNWRREKADYDGLPESAEEAAARVQERLVIQDELIGKTASWRELPTSRHTPFTLDLRTIPPTDPA